MTSEVKSCQYEDRVAEAARSGNWSPELIEHRDGCLGCAELTLVAAMLTTDAESLMDDPRPLPDPQVIWLRSQLATREKQFHKATRAIVWVQRATIAVSLAVGLVFVPGLWNFLRGFFANLDLSSPIANLPRAAGSPLLVVIMSLLVLGMMALVELTASPEN